MLNGLACFRRLVSEVNKNKTELDYIIIMNNTFRINTVYTNGELQLQRASYATNSARFYGGLYKDDASRCPWPISLKMFREQLVKHHLVFDYFVPIKRTKHFLTIQRPNYTQRVKIRVDHLGNEFIEFEGITFYPALCEMQISPETAKMKYDKERINIAKEVKLINKIMHIEDYGYVYVANGTKVTSIEELMKLYK